MSNNENKDIYDGYVTDISDLDEKIKDIIMSLSKAKVFKHLVKFKGKLNNVDEKLLKDIVTRCGELRFNDTYEILEYNLDGVWREVPDIETGIKDMPVDITNFIPEPPYDVDAEGDADTILEIRNFYICAVISTILKDEFNVKFSEKFELIRKSKKLFSTDDENSFTKLLESFQRLNSATITILVSACLIKISEKRESGDFIKIKGLSTEEYLDIRKTSNLIKEVNREWNGADGELSQERQAKMNKLEILQTLSRKDEIIFNIIENSKYPSLYRINKINPEQLGANTKNRIEISIEKEASKFRIDLPTKDYNKLISRVRRKAARIACLDLIAVEMDRYRKDPSSYKFKTKR